MDQYRWWLIGLLVVLQCLPSLTEKKAADSSGVQAQALQADYGEQASNPGVEEEDAGDVQVYQGVRGRAGVDFPVLARIPRTSFSCKKFRTPGYYADLETRCQVFHNCESGRKMSFLCPNGTIFMQSKLTCDWWFNVDCTVSEEFYTSSSEQVMRDRGTGAKSTVKPGALGVTLKSRPHNSQVVENAVTSASTFKSRNRTPQANAVTDSTALKPARVTSSTRSYENFEQQETASFVQSHRDSVSYQAYRRSDSIVSASTIESSTIPPPATSTRQWYTPTAPQIGTTDFPWTTSPPSTIRPKQTQNTNPWYSSPGQYTATPPPSKNTESLITSQSSWYNLPTSTFNPVRNPKEILITSQASWYNQPQYTTSRPNPTSNRVLSPTTIASNFGQERTTEWFTTLQPPVTPYEGLASDQSKAFSPAPQKFNPRPGLNDLPLSASPQALHSLARYFASDNITREEMEHVVSTEAKELMAALMPRSSSESSTKADLDSLSPDLRQLAQVFSKALSDYLHDPDNFKKSLNAVRPTHPPTLENAVDEEDEVLDYSDGVYTKKAPATTQAPSTTLSPPVSITSAPEFSSTNYPDSASTNFPFPNNNNINTPSGNFNPTTSNTIVPDTNNAPTVTTTEQPLQTTTDSQKNEIADKVNSILQEPLEIVPRRIPEDANSLLKLETQYRTPSDINLLKTYLPSASNPSSTTSRPYDNFLETIPPTLPPNALPITPDTIPDGETSSADPPIYPFKAPEVVEIGYPRNRFSSTTPKTYLFPQDYETGSLPPPPFKTVLNHFAPHDLNNLAIFSVHTNPSPNPLSVAVHIPNHSGESLQHKVTVLTSSHRSGPPITTYRPMISKLLFPLPNQKTEFVVKPIPEDYDEFESKYNDESPQQPEKADAAPLEINESLLSENTASFPESFRNSKSVTSYSSKGGHYITTSWTDKQSVSELITETIPTTHAPATTLEPITEEIPVSVPTYETLTPPAALTARKVENDSGPSRLVLLLVKNTGRNNDGDTETFEPIINKTKLLQALIDSPANRKPGEQGDDTTEESAVTVTSPPFTVTPSIISQTSPFNTLTSHSLNKLEITTYRSPQHEKILNKVHQEIEDFKNSKDLKTSSDSRGSRSSKLPEASPLIQNNSTVNFLVSNSTHSDTRAFNVLKSLYSLASRWG